MKFKAAILIESKKPLVIEEIEIKQKLTPGQVLVSMITSGICGAQINEIDAKKGVDKFLPHLLGHEGFAEVLEIGPQVKHVNVGDRVILHWMQGEGFDSETPTYFWKGKTVNAGWVTTFNEFAVVSANRCTKVMTTLESIQLPILGCAITTAWGTLNNEAKLKLGDSIVIFGSGGVGISLIAMAKSMGANHIVTVDLNKNKLNQALKVGADYTIMNDKNLLTELSNSLLAEPKDFFDVIIETTGNREMIELAYDITSNQSVCVLVGVPDVNNPANINTLDLHFGKRFFGTKGGRIKPQEDIPKLIKSIERKIIDFDNMTLEKFKFDDVNIAIDRLKSHQAPGRCVLDFTKS